MPAKKYNHVEQLMDGTTHIELTQGQWAIVDTHVWNSRADIREISWCARWDMKGNRFYVLGTLYIQGRGRCVSIHRMIRNVDEPKMMVDHLNGDTLDNRLNNLRVCSTKENQSNTKNHRSGRLLYATFHRSRWQSKINFQKERYYLGSFSTELEAHLRGLEAEKFLYPSNNQPDFQGFLEWRKTLGIREIKRKLK